MTEIHQMREIENLLEQVKSLEQSNERLKQSVVDLINERIEDAILMDRASDEIEKLRAALRDIAKHPRGGVIDTLEKMERDEFIGIARAALEEK